MLGSASRMRSLGSTSGTPPTLVLTTCRLSGGKVGEGVLDIRSACSRRRPHPQQAASTIAMQNASVREVLRKMSPCTSTPLTSECSSVPRRRTRSCSWCCSHTSSRRTRLGPSPPREEGRKRGREGGRKEKLREGKGREES